MSPRFFHRRSREAYSGLVQTPDGAIHLVPSSQVNRLHTQLYCRFLDTVFSGMLDDVGRVPALLDEVLEHKQQEIADTYGRSSLQMAVFLAAGQEATGEITARLPCLIRRYIALGNLCLSLATLLAPLAADPTAKRAGIHTARQTLTRLRASLSASPS